VVMIAGTDERGRISAQLRSLLHFRILLVQPRWTYRYREAPHLKVTFQTDFSTRLEPQPGMKVLYARTSIDSDRDQVKKLYIGYGDDVRVFLNGQILFRGRSAQSFRDPGFLGIVNPENDAVYLPLKKGSNELVLAVSELGGGWGFICSVAELEN